MNDMPQTADAGPARPEQLEAFREKYQQLVASIGQVVIGQEEVVEHLLIAIFSRGHTLLVGVPGLAKTLLVNTLSQALHWSFKRIQFTPDLMPTDITGSEILQTDPATGERTFRFVQGPIFANLILADEINRTPPKTQAALLEAMQEYSVTVSGRTMPLALPFTVVATQNPIEHEGTYPLPEAQLDRFMFCIHMGYPDHEAELRIVEETTSAGLPAIDPMFRIEEILALQSVIRRVPVSDHVLRYAVELVRASRPTERESPAFVRDYVEWGAGLRASQYLILAAKVRALAEGRSAPWASDVRRAALPVLRHRILPNYNATGEGIDADQLVHRLVDHVKEPDYRP
jgi:MoxR-like ATPase